MGLHSYVDPQDNNQYLYTQLESHYAHLLMPCFDQPNLKSSLTLQVNAPKEWEVIANSLLRCKFERAELNEWHLWNTQRISTYLYAICAGPFFARHANGVVPYRILCRKSFEKYLTEEYAKEWFEIQDHSLNYYSDFMNLPYPYSKLDSVICPEYNFGAMENVGCITYTEGILFKT